MKRAMVVPLEAAVRAVGLARGVQETLFIPDDPLAAGPSWECPASWGLGEEPKAQQG